MNGSEVTLPDNFCYVVHITGEGITETSPDQAVCGPDAGIGQLSPLAYNRGDKAELTIKIGPKRRFDLIGFVSPLGADSNGRAICGELSVEHSTGALPNDRGTTLKVKGVKVDAPPILFATGTGDVGPGDNVISLSGVALVSAPIMGSLTFGAPYLRKDIPGAAPAGCPATVVETPVTPKADQTLFVTPGAIVAAPKASNESSQVKLQMVTTSPVLLVSPEAGGQGSQLSTGLLEIERQRK